LSISKDREEPKAEEQKSRRAEEQKSRRAELLNFFPSSLFLFASFVSLW
jgi:hypothetical protein